MRKITRLIAGLGLLGSAACAQAAVTADDWPGEPPLEDPLPAAYEPAAETPPAFMLRVGESDSARAEKPLYLMDGNVLVGEPYVRPVDIVSVEVVTGEAAALRYGVEPWRTVVLVSTTWGQTRGQS